MVTGSTIDAFMLSSGSDAAESAAAAAAACLRLSIFLLALAFFLAAVAAIRSFCSVLPHNLMSKIKTHKHKASHQTPVRTSTGKKSHHLTKTFE